MTTSFDERAKKVLLWIVGINIGIFLLQNILARTTGAPGLLEGIFGLSIPALQRGYVWTPLTYAFLHDPSGVWHILFNLLFIYLLGRQVFGALGQKRFIQLYLATAVAGGALYLLTSLINPSGRVIGASSVFFGIFAFWVMLAPEEEVLAFFVLRMKRKVMGYILLGITLFGLLFQEIFNNGMALSYTAHSAHLGGMIGGWAFFKYVFQREPYGSDSAAFNLSFPKIFKKSPPKRSTKEFRYSVNVSSEPTDLKAEVDRILDKINSKGFGSLSPSEKKTLDEARELLRRR